MKRVDWSLLAETLHRAALDGSGWEPALQAFAQATGSRSAQLCGLQADNLLFNVITNIDPAMTRILAETAAENPRVPVANTVPVLGTMADGDFLSSDQHRRHPFYRQVCWPWDVPYICLTALQRTDDMSVILAAIRSRENGHISTTQRAHFTQLARHVQSAVAVHMAVERKGTALMAGALEALQCAAFICDHRGYVRAMTPAGEQLVSGEGPLSLRDRVLCARDAESTTRLLEAVRAAGAHRAPIDRFRKRTVRIALGEGGVANLEVFALPEQPYELPFWPTVLIVVREIQTRGVVTSGGPPSTAQALDRAVHRRARRAESALDSAASAAFVLDGTGRVVHHNAAAALLLRQEDALRQRDQRLQTADPLLQSRLQSLIAAAAAASAAGVAHPGGAIALPRPTAKHSLQVMVLPLRLAGADATAHVLVLVGDPSRQANLPKTVLGGLYGLTRAEVEIANGLLDGCTVEQIARQRGVTVGTLRMQLKSIFQKTGTRRQSDLLRLLLTLPTGPIVPK